MTDPRIPREPAVGVPDPPRSSGQPADLDRSGARLVTGLHAVEKALRVYELNNRAVLSILDDLAEAIRAVPGLGERGPCIELRGEDVFLNALPLRLGYKVWLRARDLGQGLQRRGIRGLVLPPEPTRQKLQLFFARLQKVKMASAPEAAGPLAQIVAETGGSVLSCPPLAASSAACERDRYVVRLYAVLAVLLRDLLDAARAGKRITLVPLKRVIQQVADQLDGREALLLALMDLPGYRGHPETHLANVSLLALAVGRRLRLPPRRLMQLALAAAVHELPAAMVPRDVQARLERDEALSASEQAIVDGAPRHALLYLLQAPGASSVFSLGEVVTLAEARSEFGAASAYQGGCGTSVLSRLLAIVNAYDLLLRPVGAWDPLLPAEAMRWLLVDQAHRFDPVLLDAFGLVLGLFPTGSLVELNTGEIAVVVGQQREAGLLGAPIVEVLTSDDGEPMSPERVDLATDGRAIRAPLDPLGYGFDPLQHFLRGPGISL
jgi:hypothetical protein